MEVVGIMVTNAIIAETARRVSEKIFYAMSDAPKVKYPDLVAVYDELDLAVKLETVQALLDQILAPKKKGLFTKQSALQKSLQAVHETVAAIERNLKRIDNAVLKHEKSKWRGYFMAPEYEKPVEALRNHVSLLDTRMERLLQMLLLGK